MGIYFDAVSNQTRCVESLSHDSELLYLPNIGTVAIRSTGAKGQLLQALFQRHGLTAIIHSPAWKEDKHKHLLLSPAKSAAYKTIDLDLNTDIRNVAADRLAPGLIINIASDVVQKTDGQILHKPTSTTTKETIYNSLFHLLCVPNNRKFTAHVGIAALAKEPNYPEDQGRGFIAERQSDFTISPLLQDEIDFYLYGIAGHYGTYPKRMRVISSELKEQFGLTERESQVLARGLTLNELTTTNNGLRWLHPLLQRHILSIDGIGLNDSNFSIKLNRLYRMLLGGPSELISLLQQLNKQKTWSVDDASLFPNLLGDWQELVVSSEDKMVFLSSINPSSDSLIKAISALTQDNFRQAISYRDLDDSHKESFIETNSPENTYVLCTHTNNICALFSHSPDGQVTGYVVVREKKGQPNIAQIRRIHVAHDLQHQGTGKSLLQRVEAISKEQGFKTIEVSATGSSSSWFAKNGYRLVSESPLYEGIFTDEQDPPVIKIMEKQL